MYQNWKINKNDYKNNKNQEQEEYANVAEWCNENQTHTIEDMGEYYAVVKIPEPSEEEIKQARISELEAYLSSTDWYAIRESETGVDIPADVKQARADARAEISRLRGE